MGRAIPPSAALAALILAFAAPTLVSAEAAQARTAAITAERREEDAVAARYPEVRQLSIQDYDRLVAAGTPIVLVDVREPEEFSVSHLRGAVRVDPDSNAETARRGIGPVPRDAVIVLYCTIGFRSSRLAARLGEAYGGAAGSRIVSLRGGVIGWANAGRNFVNARGETARVHPYDVRRLHLLAEPERAEGSWRPW